MNTALLQRMFWKEYRLLRAPWLALFGIGFFLEVAAFLFVWFTSKGPRRPVDYQWLWNSAWVISVMNLMAAWAVLFADEREKRTADWLVSLSGSPTATLATKFGVAIASSLSMAVAMSLVTWTLFGRFEWADIRDLEWAFFPTAIGIIVFGALGSLLSRQALWSVFAMAFWCLVMAGPSSFWFSNSISDARMARTIYLSESLLFLPIVGWLAWRWCHGTYYDGDFAKAGLLRLQAWARQRLGWKEAVISRLPKQAESGQQLQRVWQRLVWQERTREWSHKPLLLACGLMALCFQTGEFWSGFAAVWYVFLIPTLMGVLSFASSERQVASFLGQRAVSPGLVWLAKQRVWLPRACLIPALIWVGTWLVQCFGFRWSPAPEWAQSIATRGQGGDFAVHAGELPLAIFALIILNYAFGQTCGLLTRASLVAGIASMLFNFFTASWFTALVVEMDIPLSLAVIPLILGLFWLTFRWGAGWSIENLPHPLRQIGSVLGILLLALAALVIFRIYEPVWKFSAYSQHVTSRTFPMAELERRHDRPFTEQELEFREKLMNVLYLTEQNPDVIFRPEIQAWRLKTSAAPIIIDLLQTDNPSLARCLWTTVNSLDSYSPILNDCLLSYADECLTRGDCDLALRAYLINLKYYRLFAEGRPLFAEDSYRQPVAGSYLKPVFEKLLVWSNHAQQTPERILKGIQLVEGEMAKFPHLSDHAFELHHLFSDRLTKFLEDDELFAKTSAGDSFRNAATFPWELARMRNCLFQKLALSTLILKQVEKCSTAPQHYWSDALCVQKYGELARMTSSEFGGYSLDNYNISTDLTYPIAFFKDRVGSTRRTLIQMAMIAFYKVHRRFPNNLRELNGSLQAETMIDPVIGGIYDLRESSPGHWLLNHDPIPFSPMEWGADSIKTVP